MFLLMLGLLAAPAAAADFQIQYPVLMTSAGQSSDIAMAEVLLNTRLNLGFGVERQALPGDLEGIRTLVLVVGASAKGLGDAGLNADQEYARLQELIQKAQAENIGIVVLHTGGMARRGGLSDRFIEQTVKAADYIIAVAAGNEDGFFTRLTADSPGVYTEVATIVDVADVVLALLAE